MKTFKINIDKSSIKKNKNAGSTVTNIPTNKEIYFSCKSLPSNFIDKQNVIITEYYLNDDGKFIDCEGIILDESLLDNIPPNVKINIQFNHYTVYHQPIAKYSFEYENPLISCSECDEYFYFNELLENDNDEYYSNTVCPKCGEIDCCKIEYQNINEINL